MSDEKDSVAKTQMPVKKQRTLKSERLSSRFSDHQYYQTHGLQVSPPIL